MLSSLFLPNDYSRATLRRLVCLSINHRLLPHHHSVPTCAKRGKTAVARELKVGDCVMTVDGDEAVASIASSKKKGIFTAVTEDKFIVVDGVIASPFSQDRKIERQHQTHQRQRLLQRERMLLRKGSGSARE